jgi:hypothetical protein
MFAAERLDAGRAVVYLLGKIAPVAQWIEQRFPKPLVASSILAGGAISVSTCPGYLLAPARLHIDVGLRSKDHDS